MFLPNGGLRTVIQLHTEEWPDLTAPEEPRLSSIYRHLEKFPECCWTWCTRLTLCRRTRRSSILTKIQVSRYHSHSLLSYVPGTILVHCSAGVGRTGTFLAVYKLWLDYINPEVKELAVFPTVLELRKQRCKMVQKKEQYAYIAKCLR